MSMAGAARTSGFTLLEMSVSVTVIGLLAAIASTAYSGMADVRARSRAHAEADTARHAIRTFMLQHKRLPCPDPSSGGDGAREPAGACPGGLQVGWLPYESIGLARPEPARRMRYAVSRGTGADLVVPTGSAADGVDIDGIGRLQDALIAAAQAPAGTARPFVTGKGTAADAESCAHVVANPAFAIIAPVADRDDAGGSHPRFDGINQAMADSDALCIAAPGRAMDAGYDDVVVAESASALLGWLATSTR